MPTNDFLLFGCDPAANVPTQSTYAGSTVRTKGHVSGVASSSMVNKAARQASIIATAIAQLIADTMSENVVDDGTTANIEEQIIDTIVAVALAGLAGQTINNVTFINCNEASQNVTAAATTTLDYSLGGVVNMARGAAVTTLAFSNLPAPGKVAVFNLRIQKDVSATAWGFTWPANIKWPNGTPPPMTQTASGRDWVTLITDDQGATFDGSWNPALRTA